MTTGKRNTQGMAWKLPPLKPATPAWGAWFQQALESHRQGRLDHAQRLYEQILAAQPRHFGATHMLGVLLYQRRQYREAHGWLVKALQIEPRDPAAHTNLGLVLGAVGRHEDALQCHDQAVGLRPDFVEAWINRGGALRELRRFEDALQSYERALALRPDAPQAQLNRGIVLLELERAQEALAALDALTQAHSDYAQAWHQRGNALAALGRREEAQASYDRAVKAAPHYADVWVDMARLHTAEGRLDEALDGLNRALSLNPALPVAYVNRGNLLRRQDRWKEALEDYNRAVSLAPMDAMARFNRAPILTAVGQKNQAVEDLDFVIQQRPELAEAYVVRAGLLKEAGLYPEALDDFQQLLAIKGDSGAIAWLPDILNTQASIADWRQWSEGVSRLASGEVQCADVSGLFSLLALVDDPALHQAVCDQVMRKQVPEIGGLGPIAIRPPRERIRVGYFSADFHQHATMVLMAELFELHDRQRFEWYAFSFGPRTGDAMQQRAQAAFDRFIDVRDMSPLEIARLARELEIDIAVDLKGHTQDARTAIFAYRAAPIQVNYIGYPGTMAAEYYDYIVADPVVIPDELRRYYSEKVVRLPHSYQVNDRARRIADRVFTRAECGLPDEGVVYCCFNAVYKITPDVFACWMRILQAVPGSVLWLYEGNRWAPDNLRKEAARHGVDPQRLVFAPNMPNAEHLARVRLADLFLDTLPYNAHTTASDALWAGLPVLTRIGQSFAARVAASLLTAVGMPELIVRTPEAYEALAIALGREPARLIELRQRLLAGRETAPLWDTPRFARHLESAYEQMMHRWWNGLAPEHIDVAP
ncbi:TPR repeat-containing protein YrrB [Tepidimonas fonticaldi]|uniref:protein O-GlcNAc transferase n=2 Tax=Burkholderiales TaxID=80840 RepID=A0A554XIN3_9BURK|nr:glycosyltransferase family 41 protein [Tepidimonas fonticaldi]TSE35703.1 TPR repeat-containing protein YrrB [Tepidimonas fonticaldi]